MSLRGLLNRGRDVALIALETAIDARRYIASAGLSDRGVSAGRPTGRNLEAQLTKDYHRIEKGLTFAEPRRPFGDAVQARLEHFAATADDYGVGWLVTEEGHVPTALAALAEWNSSGVVSDVVAPAGSPIVPLPSDEADRLFLERHSLRNFDAERTVDREALERILMHTGRTPSVCNRQAGRIHLYSDPQTVQKVLTLQAGSAGFRETIPHVAVVTAESALFTGAGERNQPWIDGGLMAMTLVWAMQAAGVHTCMLNWSKRNHLSTALRKVTGIPDSEAVICVVAFGYPPESGYRVARSPRRPVPEFVTGLDGFEARS